MADNMPILWQNCILQYQTEIARKAWIWFAATRGEGMQFEADSFAREVELLVLALRPMFAAGMREHRGSDEQCEDLLGFTLVRHANFRLGGNVRPTYIGGVA
ncbi:MULTISPECIES: hypothetical protein [unclassified Yoonia]|uniref:hypothetical protein n=1 Tax=unclassified Yoonia TaxID=2629118 RepID=UPI002AFED3D8|nr:MULTISPECIES: hypothetical protein [unclassified Yoonia]